MSSTKTVTVSAFSADRIVNELCHHFQINSNVISGVGEVGLKVNIGNVLCGIEHVTDLKILNVENATYQFTAGLRKETFMVEKIIWANGRTNIESKTPVIIFELEKAAKRDGDIKTLTPANRKEVFDLIINQIPYPANILDLGGVDISKIGKVYDGLSDSEVLSLKIRISRWPGNIIFVELHNGTIYVPQFNIQIPPMKEEKENKKPTHVFLLGDITCDLIKNRISKTRFELMVRKLQHADTPMEAFGIAYEFFKGDEFETTYRHGNLRISIKASALDDRIKFGVSITDMIEREELVDINFNVTLNNCRNAYESIKDLVAKYGL